MSDGENRTVLALCGDAAFQTHFWPGRGMNSVIKEASMLACSVVRSALRLRQQNQGYRLSANTREFNTYTQFVNGLREREHKGRSVVRVEIFFVIFFPPLSTRSDQLFSSISFFFSFFLSFFSSQKFLCCTTGKDRMTEILDEAKEEVHNNAKWKTNKEGIIPGVKSFQQATDELIGGNYRILQRKKVAESSKWPGGWPHEHVPEEEVTKHAFAVLSSMSPFELQVMSLSQAWPSANGEEVLPISAMIMLEQGVNSDGEASAYTQSLRKAFVAMGKDLEDEPSPAAVKVSFFRFT